MPDIELPQSRDPTCSACELHLGARSIGTPTVELEPNPDADPSKPILILWGRNPGAQEDRDGMPFIGDAGERLWKEYLPRIAYWSRCSAAYCLNAAARCWTPGNSPPVWTKHTVPCWLHTQDDLSRISSMYPTQPMAWLTMGKEAAHAALILALGQKVARDSLEECLRQNGRTYLWKDPGIFDILPHQRNVFVVHTYHPAATLRNENYLPHVHDHLNILIRWLDGNTIGPSRPRIVPPFHPSRYKAGLVSQGRTLDRRPRI